MRDWRGAATPREAAAYDRAQSSVTYAEASGGYDEGRPESPALEVRMSNRTAYLVWKDTITPLNVSVYVIERSEISRADQFVEVGTTQSLTFIDTNLDLGKDRAPKTYWWRVYARTKFGREGEYSNVAEGTASGLGPGELAAEAVEVANLRDYSVDITKLDSNISELIQSAHLNVDALWEELSGAQDGIVATDDEITLTKSQVSQAEKSIAQLKVTVDQIQSTIAEIDVENNANFSQITQNAQDIQAVVTSGNLDNGEETWLKSIISQTAERIESLVTTGSYDGATGTLVRQESDTWSSTVGRIDTVEENQDTVLEWGSRIQQTEDEIAFLVKAQQDLDWDDAQNKAAIAATQDQIQMLVQHLDDSQNQYDAQLNIQSDAITSRVRAIDKDRNTVSSAFLQVGVNPPAELTQADVDQIADPADKDTVLDHYTWNSSTQLYNIQSAEMTETLRTTIVSILTSAGVPASQIILDAEEVLIPGTVIADHIKSDQINAEHLEAGQIDAVIAKLGSISTSHISFTPVEGDNVIASINATEEALSINADKVNLQDVFAQSIFINSGGSIRSGAYSESGSHTGGAGFYLGDDGHLKANEATLEDVNAVNGFFSGVIDSGPLLLDPATTSRSIQLGGKSAKDLYENDLSGLIGGSWRPVSDLDFDGHYNADFARISYEESTTEWDEEDGWCTTNWSRTDKTWKVEARWSSGSTRTIAVYTKRSEGYYYYCIAYGEMTDHDSGYSEWVETDSRASWGAITFSGQIYRLRNLPGGPGGTSGDVYVDKNGFLKVTP